MKEQIAVALRKLGPSSPTAIANEIKGEPSVVGYHLRAMLEAKALVAAGVSRGRVYGLPDQKLKGDAPPQPGKQRKPRQHRKTHRARQAPAPRAAERFVPTVDADLRLHILNGGAPVSFDGPQTEAIATLLLQHYKA